MRLMAQVQCGQGQGPQDPAQGVAIRDHPAMPLSCQGQCPTRGRCQASGVTVAQACDPGGDLIQEGRVATEQAQAGGHIQHQGPGRGQADHGGEADGPGGQPLQGGCLGLRAARQEAQVRRQGQGRPRTLARPDPAPRGGGVA